MYDYKRVEANLSYSFLRIAKFVSIGEGYTLG